MNEPKNILAILFLFFTISFCQGSETKSQLLDRQTFLVDYKKDKYKISIGETYRVSNEIIHWHWAAENDRDGRIDSTGKDAFFYLEEPLIKYNGAEWLPALHIQTDKNIITSFTCSILFDLAENKGAETDFLNCINKDIIRLQNSTIVKALIRKGIYEQEVGAYLETYRLTKGKENGHDKFEYTVQPKFKNG